MPRRRHSAEQIIRKLREAEAILSSGKAIDDQLMRGQWVRRRYCQAVRSKNCAPCKGVQLQRVQIPPGYCRSSR